MTNTAMSILRISTFALFTAGCPAPGAESDVEFRDTWGCPPLDCPPNSPRVNDYPIPELNVDGLYNDNSVRLVGIRSQSDALFELDVNYDSLVAKDAQGIIVAAHSGLVGWRIELETMYNETFYLHVRGYTNIDLSMSNYPQTLSAYALAYKDPDVPKQLVNVCPEAFLDPDATVVTVIGGETYDRDAITVNAGMAGWFTLACSKEANYKMKMMGYSPSVPLGLGPNPSTWQQRQATLKMITADYCGTGVSYTQQNTPVNWHNADSSVGAPVATLALEAHWDENGAMCLTNQRRPELPVDCIKPDCVPGPFVDYEWTTRVPSEEGGTSTGP